MRDQKSFFVVAINSTLIPVASGIKECLKLLGHSVNSNFDKNEGRYFFYSSWITFYEPITFWSRFDHLILIIDNGIESIPIEVKKYIANGEKLGMPVSIYQFDGTGLNEYKQSFLKDSEIISQLQQEQKWRESYTSKLKKLRIDVDYSSTALWVDGKNLSYDCIDLPFPLVRRLQRWAEVYDRFLWPEPGDNLDEIDSWFTLEQQRLAEEVKRQLPSVEVIADEV